MSLDAALERLRAGQPRAALPLLETHVAGRSADVRAWYLLGACRHELRDAAGAENLRREVAAGMLELVASDPEAFVNTASALGNDLAALGRLEAKLRANRATAPLFDTTSRVRQLEDAFAELYRRHQARVPPASFGL